jgi:hypothetical protein
MTPQPTTETEGPAQPDNVTPIGIPSDDPAPTPEQIEAARKAVEEDMREALPFNRLAIHVGFQRAIQGAVAGNKPEKVRPLCAAFRSFAEAESLLK